MVNIFILVKNSVFSFSLAIDLFIYLFWDRKMASIEDDAYSFGFILLEALVGPSLAATREIFLLKEMVRNDKLVTLLLPMYRAFFIVIF